MPHLSTTRIPRQVTEHTHGRACVRSLDAIEPSVTVAVAVAVAVVRRAILF